MSAQYPNNKPPDGRAGPGREWRSEAACRSSDPEHVDRTTDGDQGVSAPIWLMRQIVLLAWVMIRTGLLSGWRYRGGAVS